MSIRVSPEGHTTVSPEGYSSPREAFARIPVSVWEDRRLKRADVHVYRVLAQAVWQGSTASVGLRRIATEAAMTLRNVHASIKRLTACGHVKMAESDRGQRALYILTSPVFGQKQGKVDEVVSTPRGRRLASVRKTA